MAIDPQYTVGFMLGPSFLGFRVSKNISNQVWLAASVENPQTTFTAHGQATNFDFGTAGNSSGLYNAFNGTYSFNKAPDIIAKQSVNRAAGRRIFACSASSAIACILTLRHHSQCGWGFQ